MSSRKSPDYHHGALRDAIIKRTLEHLKSQSMEAISLRKIAKDLGVSHNAPYMHFKDKEALWTAISVEGFKLLARDIMTATADQPDWRKRLVSGCVAYVEFSHLQREYFLVMFRPKSGPQDSTAIASNLETLSILTDELRRGMEDGHIRPTDPDTLASTFWAILHGAAMIRIQSGAPPALFRDSTGTAKLIESLLVGCEVGRSPES